VGDQWGIAYSLNDLGLMLHLQDDAGDAERHVEQSRAMLRRLGDRRGAAFAAYNLGMIASRRGDHERARQFYRESLSLREEGRDQWGIGASLVQLASETRALGDRAESRELYLAALRTAWNSSVRPVVLEALVGVSTLMIDEGDDPGADAILTQVVAHPATPGQLRNRIAALRPDLEPWSGSATGDGRPESWAVRAVDETARTLVSEQQNASAD
jgi:tetratricopeptide (TPR) repeat protein